MPAGVKVGFNEVFSPDGKTAGHRRRLTAAVRLWDLVTGKPAGAPLPAGDSRYDGRGRDGVQPGWQDCWPPPAIGRPLRLWDLATGTACSDPRITRRRRRDRGGVQPGRQDCWPPPTETARCGCGIRPPARPLASPLPDRHTGTGLGWRSARTASCWPPPTETARSGCGIRPPARPPGAILPRHHSCHGWCERGGVQPGRQAARHGPRQ